MGNVFAPLNTKASRLGFGLMRLPLTPDGKIDRQKAGEMIDYAYKNGIKYYDTAWGYHNEESQYFIGDALSKYPRDSFLLASKMPPWLTETEADVDRLFNEQLKRCKVDYFDNYLVHSVTDQNLPNVKSSNIYNYLKKKKEEGIIKHLGFSFHGTMETLEWMLENHQWDFVQLQINYFDFAFTGSNSDKEYEMVTAKGLPIIVMEPIRGGFLARLPANATSIIKDFNPTISPASWALKWCLDKENIPLILSGMSTMRHVEENIETFSSAEKLTPAESSMLDRVVTEVLSVDTVPCTACRYCMDCPFGVNIPLVFALYNNHQIGISKNALALNWEELARADATFDACTKCGVCVPLCPQNIDIPTQLERVSFLKEIFK